MYRRRSICLYITNMDSFRKYIYSMFVEDGTRLLPCGQTNSHRFPENVFRFVLPVGNLHTTTFRFMDEVERHRCFTFISRGWQKDSKHWELCRKWAKRYLGCMHALALNLSLTRTFTQLHPCFKMATDVFSLCVLQCVSPPPCPFFHGGQLTTP